MFPFKYISPIVAAAAAAAAAHDDHHHHDQHHDHDDDHDDHDDQPWSMDDPNGPSMVWMGRIGIPMVRTGRYSSSNILRSHEDTVKTFTLRDFHIVFVMFDMFSKCWFMFFGEFCF